MRTFRISPSIVLFFCMLSGFLLFSSSSCTNNSANNEGKDRTAETTNEDDPLAYNSGPDKYQIIVRTGCEENAGTKAKVYCILKGEKGDSKEFVLDNQLTEEFNSCSRDVFEVKIDQDLGAIKGLYLWHDNTGDDPSFKPEIIDVNYMKTNTKISFPCGKWFDTQMLDKKIRREFFDYRECK